MKSLKLIILIGALLLLAGCIQSLHPLYTEKDIVFDPALIGKWAEDDDSRETWAFSKDGTNAYQLVYTDDDGKSGTFVAHLLKIEGHLFLDLFPEEPELVENAFYQFHLLPVHSFAYVKQIEPTLQMVFSDADWLEKHLKDHPDAIQHEVIDDQPVLTASIEELQAFFLSNLTNGVFGDLSEMTGMIRQ